MGGLKEESRRGFIDTNIWLYAFVASDDVPRREAARAIVSRQDIVVSTQVINETCVNLLRKASVPEEIVRQLVAAFYEKYAVTDLDRSTLLMASELREKYRLSFWDSMIVASALRADCETLYTEDMQDGLEVEGRLTVVNPFKAKQGNGGSTVGGPTSGSSPALSGTKG
jgi:predicted nucleic acid-binding protein